MPGVLVVDIGIAQRLLKMPDQISRLLIGKAKGKRAPLETVAGDKLRLVEPDAESDLERLTDSFHLNLTAFGLLSFVVGLFIVNSAIGLAFEQRLPMLRTLRACGVSARMLNAVLLVELVSLALVAGLAGLVCGYLIAASLLPDVAASLRGLYGAQIPGQLTLKGEWWIAGLVISVAGALAAATTSLLKAIRLPVLAAAQPYAWQQAQHRWLIFQGALALAVFAAAGVLSVVRRFAGVGICRARGVAAWRGARLCPRSWNACCLSASGSARRPLAVWFWADSRQQLSGLSLALMALLLALAVNVGVGTMVETFSRTFVSWLDGRLAADVYINASGRLRRRPRSRRGCASVPKSRRSCRAAGPMCKSMERRSKFSVCPITPPIAITGRCSQSTANAWTRLRPGDAGLISEQLARRLKLAIGDRIEVPAPGGNWTLEVVGIYADYGNPKGQIAVNIAALTRRFPEIPQTRMGLRVAPAAVPALISALQRQIRARRPQPRWIRRR